MILHRLGKKGTDPKMTPFFPEVASPRVGDAASCRVFVQGETDGMREGGGGGVGLAGEGGGMVKGLVHGKAEVEASGFRARCRMGGPRAFVFRGTVHTVGRAESGDAHASASRRVHGPHRGEPAVHPRILYRMGNTPRGSVGNVPLRVLRGLSSCAGRGAQAAVDRAGVRTVRAADSGREHPFADVAVDAGLEDGPCRPHDGGGGRLRVHARLPDAADCGDHSRAIRGQASPGRCIGEHVAGKPLPQPQRLSGGRRATLN